MSPKDLELIERIVYKNGDSVAVAIGRSFERLDECIDALEERIAMKLSKIEELISKSK